jgi:hemerythrin-like domain-containing protein
MVALSQHAMVVNGLTLVHTAIRRSLDSVVATAQKGVPDAERAGFADFCQRLSRFIHGHHAAEEEIFFPVLDGELLGASVARWKREHEALLGALGDYDRDVAKLAGGGPVDAVARSAAQVRTVLFPHLDAEEAVLDEAALRKLVDGDQAMDLAMRAAKHGQKHGGPGVLMLFLHALSDEEQRSHFSRMPWFVRRVLIPIWDRGFRACVTYAHNPSIAI